MSLRNEMEYKQLEIVSLPLRKTEIDCRKCGTGLIPHVNWQEGNRKINYCVCTSCHNKAQDERPRHPNGQRWHDFKDSVSVYPKGHPLRQQELYKIEEEFGHLKVMGGNIVSIPRKRKTSYIPEFHYPPEHEKRLRRDGVSVETAIKARRDGRTDGFTYALWHPRDPDMYKIGRAYDPRSRLSTFNVGCPNALYEMHYISPYFEDAELAERTIQKMLIEHHHRAEWYKLSLDTAIEAIKIYAESIERTRREVGKGQTIPLC